jgi:Tol biopolymer transport system component
VYVGDSPSVLSGRIDWKLHPISTERSSYFLSWMAQGKLLQLNVDGQIYITNEDGTGRIPLMANDDRVVDATGCGTGDSVVFVQRSDVTTSNLFRLNRATGELKQLTFGKDWANVPSCTPDGKWVVYTRAESKMWHILKISIDGGSPSELAAVRVPQYTQAVSPDGRSIAYFVMQGQGLTAKSRIAIQPLDGSKPAKEIDAPDYATALGWTPDSRALTLTLEASGARNLYMQPLRGGPPVQLTHFDSEPLDIAGYAWSNDGKKIAITRSRHNDSDVVMFSGFR